MHTLTTRSKALRHTPTVYSYRMGEGLLQPLASEAVSVRIIEVVSFVVGIAIGLCCAYARRRRVEG